MASVAWCLTLPVSPCRPADPELLRLTAPYGGFSARNSGA